MLASNEQFIKRKCTWIVEKINCADKNESNIEIVVEKNPSRAPTIFAASPDKKIYLHSRYNPEEEAKRIIDHLEGIANYDYVVFFGFAFGYHVEYFISKYPDIPFSIYEPKFEIFKRCLENHDISFLENSRLDNFYFPDIDTTVKKTLAETLDSLECSILIIPLASYETAFPDEYNNFYKSFGQYLSNTAIVDNTIKRNEKLHTVNVLNNFSLIMNTPNIMRQKDEVFADKPAILASAGPSLEYEIENLKYIKENGLAYIFSAGSAINTLIDKGIYPNACFSIDPTENNLKVYKKMISLDIKSIPLIFGTTASARVVRSYPGNLYHFITTKDLVTPYLLGSSSNPEEAVGMASSVAVAALLLLHKLGFSPIILVGQNLAYKDQRYYASGVDYNAGSGVIASNFFEQLYKVQSVDGGSVYSNESLNCFRKDMEHYIRYYKIDNVINTTRNGATIKGTAYITLDKVIKEYLRNTSIYPEWELKLQNNYSRQTIKSQAALINAESMKFYETIHRLKNLSDRIHSAGAKNMPESLSDLFYKIFEDIINNRFFLIFLYSMNVYECKKLIRAIKSEKKLNGSVFSVSMFESFIDFINACIKDLDTILPLIEELNKQLS